MVRMLIGILLTLYGVTVTGFLHISHFDVSSRQLWTTYPWWNLSVIVALAIGYALLYTGLKARWRLEQTA